MAKDSTKAVTNKKGEETKITYLDFIETPDSPTHGFPKGTKNKQRLSGKSKSAALVSEPGIRYSAVDLNWNDDVRGHALVDMVRKGIPYANFDKIRNTISFENQIWANILGVTKRTLERYQEGNKTFRSQQSERIVQISQLYNKGLDVFGASEKLKNWLQTKNVSLGNVTPLSLLDTTIGINLVKDELVRIEHGVFV